ncbi:Crp/Fnr family transcriptional regulator [Thiosulfativibrio zosterae]|uniref:Cyclic nucleotide-binding domain-containing protein n=1 Tax=Thiosulfativibrio zosterae TaxID=2675053 RepID=A0A6F8PNB4_9GAMM|nr:cyclic nucleotide-binding domain-containing protein [Thiosulfativibrio zosterae]BBP43599.1 hypothetical protein THMIRHAT_13450 [Thiosulfativibrio zosterae]
MQEMTAAQLFDYFQQNKICESLTRNEVETMTNYLQEKNFQKDQIISDMGEVGNAMYFIIAGKVAFSTHDGQCEADVGRQTPGNLIGEMSFFDRKPRMLKMTAASKEVVLLEITRAMYDRLKVEHPYIAVNLVENAVVSLDHLIRHMSTDLSHIENYMSGIGKR